MSDQFMHYSVDGRSEITMQITETIVRMMIGHWSEREVENISFGSDRKLLYNSIIFAQSLTHWYCNRDYPFEVRPKESIDENTTCNTVTIPCSRSV